MGSVCRFVQRGRSDGTEEICLPGVVDVRL